MAAAGPPTVEETRGGKYAHGTHNYPDPLTHIDKQVWDVVIIGAGPAGLMNAVSFLASVSLVPELTQRDFKYHRLRSLASVAMMFSSSMRGQSRQRQEGPMASSRG